MLTRRRPERRSEEGFTLVELIISISILGIVISAMSWVMFASLVANRETRNRLDETRDEQFVAAYFASDVDGATAMATGTSTACGSGLAVAEFTGTSFDSLSPPNQTATLARYVLTTSTVDGVNTGKLTRYACEAPSGASPAWTLIATTIVARSLAATSPTVACFSGSTQVVCATTPAPTTMSVSFARRSGGDQFVLSGTRRSTTP
jgi:prepilin-type N-terminal cleavage/methylation domain-containing protein